MSWLLTWGHLLTNTKLCPLDLLAVTMLREPGPPCPPTPGSPLTYLPAVSIEPVGRRGRELLEGFEQPLSVQVELCCLEEKQQQPEQGGHLQEPRGTGQGRDRHGARASGWLTVPDWG